MSIPKFDDIHTLFYDESLAMRYLYDLNVIKYKKTCCNATMTICENNRRKCSRCGDIETIFKDTIFYKKKIQVRSILLLFYLFLLKLPTSTIYTMYGNRFSTKTILATRKLYQEIVNFDSQKEERARLENLPFVIEKLEDFKSQAEKGTGQQLPKNNTNLWIDFLKSIEDYQNYIK
ncbi:hypothetical protein BY458DRAFT_492192 [Sporodiniella umbellata]|nr:hypothetical protein BY458DRAFT_492192 [Sporodiniella umbellata]